jgi:hypothetical protein
MKRLILILLASISLAAGASIELFHVSPDQERRNLVEWNRMPEGERDSVRRTWQRLATLSGPQRDLTLRRMATVSRLQSRHRQRVGKLPGHAELLRMLKDCPGRLTTVLDSKGLPEGELRDRLEGRIKRLVLSFLKGLSEQGRLDAAERKRIEKLPYPRLVNEALDLQKHEEIYLLAEVTLPLQPVDVVRLQDLNPLEVAEQMRETRRRRGLLGRASRQFGLTEADRTWLADVSDEDLVKALRAVYEPKIRALLEIKGWEPDEIARFLAEPFRKLERKLDRLERDAR